MGILVVGAGAVGGYFGGRLAQAGRDVTFLVRPRRAEEIRASGLQIISPHGDATIEPNLITASAIRSAYDIVAALGGADLSLAAPARMRFNRSGVRVSAIGRIPRRKEGPDYRGRLLVDVLYVLRSYAKCAG